MSDTTSGDDAAPQTEVVVPDLVGLDAATAVTVLADADLSGTASWKNSEVDPDGSFDVYGQVPTAGEVVPSGDDVQLLLDVPPLPEVVVQESEGVIDVWQAETATERQVGWVVTDLMDPDRVPGSLDSVLPDRPSGTYTVVFRCEGAATREDGILAEASFTTGTGAQVGGRRTADDITMVDGATCP